MNGLTLVKSANFGNVQCDFYSHGKSKEIKVTREQIGTSLEYEDPRIAIAKIHDRHKNRLDKFSVVTKLTTTDGKQYDTYLYSARGVYEICRWSQQPKADAFMDFAWDTIEALRTGQNMDQKLYLRRVQFDTKKLQIEAETMRLSFLDSVKDRLSSSELVSLASSIMGNPQPRQVQRISKIAVLDAGWMIDFTAFLNDCCILSEKLICETSALYDEYVKWAQKNGEPVRTRTKFGRTLAQKGFEKERTGTGRVARRGIGVRIAEKGGEA